MTTLKTHEDVDCTSCGSSRHTEFARSGEWGVRQCLRCGMRFVSPRPTAEATSAIYDEHYFDGTGDFGNRAEDGGYQATATGYVARARHIVKWLMELTGLNGGRWLDIGCGPGYLVSVVNELGFQGVGVDISPDAVRYGRESLGLDLHEATGEQVSEVVQGPFTVISMVDTLFHLREPRGVLEQVAALLAPGGYLFAGPFDLQRETEAGSEITALPQDVDVSGWGIPEHLSFVNQASMSYVLPELGFETPRFLPLPLTPSDVTGQRFAFLPPWLKQTLRNTVRRMPAVQSAAHAVAARQVNPAAGYVLAQKAPGSTGPAPR